MRFSSLSMTSTTHIRCKVGVLAAFLAHPKYQSDEGLIREAKTYILGHHAKWAYAFHLPKEEAFEVLSKCLPEISRRQQSSGMWKRKNAEIYTYGILRALKHAELLDQDTFSYELYQGFREKDDLISILVRRNIMEETTNVENVVTDLFSTQRENGSWYNSLSATCFQLQTLMELGIDAKHKSVSTAINWLFGKFHEKFEGRARTWSFNFENIFLSDNYTAEQDGFRRVAPEHGKMVCISSLQSGADSYIRGNPAITTAIALYTLTKLGYGNDRRILDAYENLYNIRGFSERNGEINEYSWCVAIYKPKSVHYDPNRTGISFDDFLQIVKERKLKQ
ncbi:MAG: hypothetical protein ACFFBI_13100 [Promethearchaeota archaeon]